MENQSIIDSPETTSVNSAPIVQPSAPIQTKTSLVVPILFAVLVSAIVFGVGGYYFGTQKKSSTSLSPNTQVSYSPQPTAIPSVSPIPTEIPTVSEMGNTQMKNATKIISSDGKYQTWLDGKNFTATQLWTSNVDGSQKKLLVIGTDNSGNAKVGDYSLVSLVWSPNGTQIAYFRAVINNIGQLDVTDQLNLYVVNQDGTNDHLVKANVSAARGQYGKTDLQWTSEGISYTDFSSSATGTKTTIQPK
jgi:hypothetical protein